MTSWSISHWHRVCNRAIWPCVRIELLLRCQFAGHFEWAIRTVLLWLLLIRKNNLGALSELETSHFRYVWTSHTSQSMAQNSSKFPVSDPGPSQLTQTSSLLILQSATCQWWDAGEELVLLDLRDPCEAWFFAGVYTYLGPWINSHIHSPLDLHHTISIYFNIFQSISY